MSQSDAAPESSTQSASAYSRVPDPTPLFWITKGVSTALGEAVSDLSIHVMAPELAVVLGFLFFAGALTLQLSRRRYVPSVYWLAVAAVGVFGTMAADVVHVVLGLPYAATTAIYLAALLGIFYLWRRTDGTLSVHAIVTTRREIFYWAAVVFTFALGTALGDLSAMGLGLGYWPAVLLFAALIVVPAVGYRWWHFGGVFAFWFAYILTRPLGASIADGLGKPAAEGGAGIGSGWVSLVSVLLMLALVVRTQIVHAGEQRATSGVAGDANRPCSGERSSKR